jgi:hypothetical protein
MKYVIIKTGLEQATKGFGISFWIINGASKYQRRKNVLYKKSN